jgi:uncharacterized protein RhaS with RHS repeats
MGTQKKQTKGEGLQFTFTYPKHNNMETQTTEQGFKFNYSNKERAVKLLEQERIFKDLGIEIIKESKRE